MPEFVTMKHPDVEDTASVTRQAFDEIYAAKGWTIVESDGTAAKSAAVATPKKEEKTDG